jgi:hypothetical protein
MMHEEFTSNSLGSNAALTIQASITYTQILITTDTFTCGISHLKLFGGGLINYFIWSLQFPWLYFIILCLCNWL